MSSTSTADSLFAARSNNVDRYKRNFLKQVVCELRFPTLMELGEAKPPAALVTALRKAYPHLELNNEVTLNMAGGANDSNHAHLMRSSKLTWVVTVKQSSLSIETTAYSDYAELKARIVEVVAAARKIIDTDFFTRVGLRYINVIDSGTDPADGWVNPILVEPLRQNVLTGVQDYAGKILLSAPDGGCLLQHATRAKPPVREEHTFPDYYIDIDTFRLEVGVDEVPAALDRMHAQAFDVFDWSLGPKAREHLSATKPTRKGDK